MGACGIEGFTYWLFWMRHLADPRVEEYSEKLADNTFISHITSYLNYNILSKFHIYSSIVRNSYAVL